MAIFWSVFYICLVFFTGYGVISAIFSGGRKSFSEIIGLSTAVGPGCTAFFLFWLSLAGLTPSRSIFVFFAVAISILIACFWKYGRLIVPHPGMGPLRNNDWWLLIPVLVVGLTMVVISVHALGFPLYEWDAFAIWGLKAKVLAGESLRSGPQYFHDPSMSYSHLDYPLLVPFLVAGVYGIIGHIDDQVGKILFPFLYISLGLLMYSGLRWINSRKQAALLTALLMGVPVLIRWAGSGTADLVLTIYYAGSIHFTVKWLQEEKAPDLMLAILFSVFCSFTKNEGMALGLTNILILFLFTFGRINRRQVTGLVIFVVGLIFLLLPWIIWMKGVPRTHEDYLSRISYSIFVENIHRLEIIIPAFFNKFFQWNKWGGLSILLIVMAVIGWRAFRKRYVIAMWLLLGMHIGLYILIYLISPWNINEILFVSLDRLILHTTPAIIFLIGYHWAEISYEEHPLI
jgi:dolichyl-phosphate-mannose-protein mannosyltransferase